MWGSLFNLRRFFFTVRVFKQEQVAQASCGDIQNLFDYSTGQSGLGDPASGHLGI